MDIVTYILCKKTIGNTLSSLPSGFSYKGPVDYEKDLPADAENGDVYTVAYSGDSGSDFIGLNYAYYEGS